MAILTESQLERLKKHKYCAEGRSLTEFIFQPYWNWVVTLMPLWVAPNLITIVGLVLNVFTSLAVILYSPQANSNEVPSYVFVACALGLFIYQTLDAIDGKQARRTNSSSPMGELFDHGCDSVSTILVTVSVACAASLGTYKNYLFFVFINNTSLFYLAHWQTYCTGKLLFGKWDVTEAQIEACIIYLIAAVCGTDFFVKEVSFLPASIVPVKLISWLIGIGSACYFWIWVPRIFRGGSGKNGTTIAVSYFVVGIIHLQTSVLSPLVPYGIVLACAFYIFKHSAEDIFAMSPCLFMFMIGTSTSKITCNLVVASMSKSPLDMLDMCMLGPMILACWIYFGVTGWLALINITLTEYYILWGTFIFNLLNFIQYSIRICLEISESFGIAIFSIPYFKKVQ